MKLIRPSPKPTKEESSKFIIICNQGEFFEESKETTQSIALGVKEEVVSSKEISEEIKLKHVGKPNFGNIIQLFSMISKIFSCRRRVLKMQSFNFLNSYHLLLAYGRDKSMIHH